MVNRIIQSLKIKNWNNKLPNGICDELLPVSSNHLGYFFSKINKWNTTETMCFKAFSKLYFLKTIYFSFAQPE